MLIKPEKKIERPYVAIIKVSALAFSFLSRVSCILSVVILFTYFLLYMIYYALPSHLTIFWISRFVLSNFQKSRIPFITICT